MVKAALPLKEVWVQSLVRELRSHMAWSAVRYVYIYIYIYKGKPTGDIEKQREAASAPGLKGQMEGAATERGVRMCPKTAT